MSEPRLTDRQIEVARLVGLGRSYKAIGIELRISPRTAERHVHLVSDKLDDDGSTPYRRVQRWALETRPSAGLSAPKLGRMERQRRSDARKALRYAVLRGEIVKPRTCPQCHRDVPARLMTAHHQDYDRPLDVEWKCAYCHAKDHQRGA